MKRVIAALAISSLGPLSATAASNTDIALGGHLIVLNDSAKTPIGEICIQNNVKGTWNRWYVVQVWNTSTHKTNILQSKPEVGQWGLVEDKKGNGQYLFFGSAIDGNIIDAMNFAANTLSGSWARWQVQFNDNVAFSGAILQKAVTTTKCDPNYNGAGPIPH